jgi:protein involved in polysaccharide export with SLBB domain
LHFIDEVFVMKRSIITLFFALFICYCANSQQLLNQDLRTVQVDGLSDAEIKSFYDKAKTTGMGDAQIIDLLSAKGMPISEITKLQTRIKSLQIGNPSVPLTNNTSGIRSTISSPNEVVTVTLDSLERQIYGMDLFTTPSLSFEPNLRLATSPGYILGPDDELQINIYGYSEAQYKCRISPEGTISIPNVGQLYINGLTIAAATAKITQKLSSTIYRAISSGKTHVNVTLANVRSIKITVIGQARKPGAYTVSSFSTLFNILYLCGGPNKEGSFRNIQVIRAGGVIKTVDLYKFLNSGDITSNISLQENDVIRIPYYQKRIRLFGEFKRPGYYELNTNENLTEVFNFAGGFSDSAYRQQVRVFQIGGRERKITVLSSADFDKYVPKTGDEVNAERVSNRYENRVSLQGAVNRPGLYDLSEGLTVKQLLQKADGLREEAYTSRASILRLQEDLTREVIAFDVRQILNGSAADIALKKEDVIRIPSILDIKDFPTITVEGEVRRPMNNIPYRTGMTIKDAILDAGGFTEAATGKRLEIGRRIVNAADGKDNTQVAEVIVVDTETDLSTYNSSVKLQPNDILVVRNNPGYFVQRTVAVAGEIKYSGKYIIAEKNERLSDLITRAGGLTALADAGAASLERQNRNYARDTAYKKNTLDRLGFDSAANFLTVEKIGINLIEIMRNPHSSVDLILEDGDVIRVPKRDGVVKVRGEVLAPTQLSFIEGEDLDFYISRAGGFTQNAIKRKTFVIEGNGNAKRTRSFFFFKKYPSIKAGDEIYVPRKAEARKGLSLGEVTALASLASIILAIFN